MAYMNNGHAYGAFSAPNGSPGMMNQQNRHGAPRFNNGCPWRPPPERQNFNINRFMQPPHVMQRPDYAPNNIFGQQTSSGQHENFPFASPQNNRNNHGQQFPQNNHGQQINHGQQFSQNNHGQQFPQKNHDQQFPQNNHGQQINHSQQFSQNNHGHQINGQQFSQNNHGQQFSQNSRGQRFQGHPGHGRGYTRGNRGGHDFRGGFRGGFQNNNNNQPNHTNKKKEKVNKRDLPENNTYFCDICDRGFKTEEKYQEHVDGHIKCTFKDCPFIAAPKLVELHMRMQHKSGIAKRVWSLESETDIQKWRDERKRNFPTSDNVARKLQEKAEKIARGEVLQTKEFGKMRRGKGRNNRGGRGRGRGRGRWRNQDRNDDEMKSEDDSDNDSPPEEVETKKSTADNDLDNETTGAIEIKTKEPATEAVNSAIERGPQEPSSECSGSGALPLLVLYGKSSSDGEVDALASSSGTMAVQQPTLSDSTLVALENGLAPSSSATASSTVPQHQIPSTGTSAVHKEFSQPDTSNATFSAVEDTPQIPHIVLPQSAATTSSANSESTNRISCPNIQENHQDRNNVEVSSKNESFRHKNQNGKQVAGGKRGASSGHDGGPSAKKKKEQRNQQLRKYTLLQKLLAPEMRRERNKILQCVHYIVKNKFFDKNHTSNQDPTVPEMTS